MLYRPKTHTAAKFAKHVLGAITGLFAGIGRNHSDGAYLDGMRNSELEDLGIRRNDEGGYRMFK